jgi:hypothetical protein
MKHLSRRSVLTGLAALAPASIALAAHAAPDPDRPITPAEYLAEMEANGWRPATDSVRGEPRGVFEYCVRHKLPTREDMNFLYDINCRANRSGDDFYKRTARYLFEQGRIGRVWP